MQAAIEVAILLYNKMGERKAWTQEQDRVLKQLYEQSKITKWSEIARIMASQYNITSRNGKQCRERYHNHLDNSIKRDKWSQAEENDLISLHNTMGNRWAQISRAITGRSQNCVKNKFYSILRRGLKYINSAIKNKLKRYKALDIDIVYKIVQACESSYKKKSLSKEMLQNLDIKRGIIYYGLTQNSIDEEDAEKMKDLIEKIKNFSKSNTIRRDKPQKTAKKQCHSLQSDEVQSSEFRDEITDLRAKRTSLQNLIAQQPDQQEPEEGSQTKISYLPLNNLYKINKLSSKQSNKSFEQYYEGRPYDLLIAGQSMKSFEIPEFDITNRSPRPAFSGESPYFDQLRPSSSFNSWSQFYAQ